MIKRAYEQCYGVSYTGNGKETRVETFDDCDIDLSIINGHFKIINTDFVQDGVRYVIMEDQRPEWFGDLFAYRHRQQF